MAGSLRLSGNQKHHHIICICDPNYTAWCEQHAQGCCAATVKLREYCLHNMSSWMLSLLLEVTYL